MADVGFWTVIFCLLLSVYSAAMWAVGTRRRSRELLESARNGTYAAAAAATIASLALIYLLLTRDFSVRYVYEHTSSHLPTIYVLSAFWAGQEGSLLLWLWLTTLLAVWLVSGKAALEKPSIPYAVMVLAFTQAFLALVTLVLSSPFESLGRTPVDGYGLNPLLQNIGMVIHPPVVFVGYALYTVPFALAFGALLSGELTRDWLRSVRRWSLMAWLLLGAGILLGAWWAYLELGWGGYWAWDPVENASLIPWLTGTALIHSLMVQERRDAFKVWNLALIAMTFLLCIFATFITRSGLIQSVHAFGRSPIGYYFMAFMVVAGAAMGVLAHKRRRLLAGTFQVENLLSREASLLLTNLLFIGTALVVLLGTLFPALMEALQGQQAALGADFYGRTVVPLSALIVLFIGICPWLSWGNMTPGRLARDLAPSLIGGVATAALLFALGVRRGFALFSFAVCAFVAVSIVTTVARQVSVRRKGADEGALAALGHLVARNRRRYGAYIVHLAIVLIAMGITGSSAYQSEVQVALEPGESVAHEGYDLVFRDLVTQTTAAKDRYVAVVSVQRNGRSIATLRPEKNFHRDVEQWVSEVATRASLVEDLYVSLAGISSEGLATFQIIVEPLVTWLWIGGGLMLVGSLLAWWPARTREEPAQ